MCVRAWVTWSAYKISAFNLLSLWAVEGREGRSHRNDPGTRRPAQTLISLKLKASLKPSSLETVSEWCVILFLKNMTKIIIMINLFDWQACGAAALSSWSSVLLCPSLVLLYLRCDHIVMLMMTRVFIFEMCSDEKHFSRLMPGAGLVAAQIQSRFSIWENDAAATYMILCGLWMGAFKTVFHVGKDTKIWQGTMPPWHHHHEYLKLWFWLILFVVWQNLASHCQYSSMQPPRRDSEKLLDKSKIQVLSSSSLSCFAEYFKCCVVLC